MGLVEILIILIVLGVGLYLVNSIIPMPAWMKTVINAIIGIALLVWALESLGFHTGFHVRL